MFDHPSLGFCLDTGHALVAAGPERAGEFFEVMAPRLIAFHLADNAGDRDSHLAPGHGLVDWEQFFRQVVRLNYAHGMCVETPPFAPGPSYSLEAWRRMFTDLDELARQAMKT
jgi:sugar phosphate isomerase/epimerase